MEPAISYSVFSWAGHEMFALDTICRFHFLSPFLDCDKSRKGSEDTPEH